MVIKNAVGRPPKVNYKIIIKLADAIQHSSNVTEACRYTGISRDTFYRHLNANKVFAEKMAYAKDNQDRVSFNFQTTY